MLLQKLLQLGRLSLAAHLPHAAQGRLFGVVDVAQDVDEEVVQRFHGHGWSLGFPSRRARVA